jgi:hypothetical protein
MTAIRVTIGDMPPLLRSLVEGMLDEDPQFEVTSEESPASSANPAAEGVDVLVISEDAMKRIVPLSAVRDASATLGVVAIASDGLDAAVVRLRSHRTRLDSEPRQTLSQAILAAAGAIPEAG